jgi:prepilin-type processing-associated H-X9-DG protein
VAEQIRCPHCGQTYELTPQQVPQYAGQTITCTACQRAFTVPRSVGAPPGAPQPAQQPQFATAYAPPGAPPPAGSDKNGAAVAGLVFSILGLLPILPIIGSIVGVVLGFVGLSKSADPANPRKPGRGLAITAIVLGFSSFFIWGVLALLISILLPSLNRARETANRVYCASNLRQIGQAELLYANENRGLLSPDFPAILMTQDITAPVFVCPASDDTPAPAPANPAAVHQQAAVLHQHCSYKYVPGQNNAAPATAVIAYEPLTNHDGDGANFLWGDGHVSWEDKQTATALIRNLEAGQNPPARK